VIRDAYERAAAIIGSQAAENVEVTLEVERLRLAWRPSDVRVVILAESHVWTSELEVLSRVRLPDGMETGFARFVYCLGYGEPSLVDPPVSRNSGTWQYWRLFRDAVRDPVTSIAEVRPRNTTERVFVKLELLNELKRAGIWLVDASVTALYKPPSIRLVSGATYNRVLKACWETHVAEVLANCSARAVLIVGKGVEAAIGKAVRQEMNKSEVIVIRQPNARMARDEILSDRRKIFDLCGHHRAPYN
jgi:hypothetical protein